jgi:hypothetical protein
MGCGMVMRVLGMMGSGLVSRVFVGRREKLFGVAMVMGLFEIVLLQRYF